MSRFSRVKQTLLFLTFCSMSYLGLICQVQILLPVNPVKRPEKDELRFLDYEHTPAVQSIETDDLSYRQPWKNRLEDKGERLALDPAGRLENSMTHGYTHFGGDADNSPLKHHAQQRAGKPAVEDMGENLAGRSENKNSMDNFTQFGGDGAISQLKHDTQRVVNFIPVGGMYVFGTFLDLRQKGNATVRLFVLQHRKDQDGLVCITANKAKKNHTLFAQPYRMCENHGKHYEGWIYSCVLPNTMKTLPQQISVAPLSQRHTRSTHTVLKLKTIPPQTEQNVSNIGVCVPPLFGQPNLASIIHFIQMCKVLGANRVFMYTGNDTSLEIKKFLIHHSLRDKDASLSMTDWNLPGNVSQSPDGVWYHGQLLAIQDCLYHNMASFRHLLFMDLDEMLMPRLTRTWPEMLDKIFTQHDEKHSSAIAALVFKSVFFDPTRLPPQDSENILYFQHVHRTVAASRVRNKLMVRPLTVFELGIHHLSKSLSDGYRSMEVREKVAVVHHYRQCEEERGGEKGEERGGGRRDMKCDLVTEDRAMLTYKDRLTRMSHRVITHASRLFA
ncbi:beta-1,4-galactosyltransferase galt-1-like [Babylonia areolata]|uniref:beta-1,4-galactosyltransferase galt-1-like n=1 Tax=Babylonia areolata TaxID=304850 RepID=UPI003FD345B0